MNDKPPESSNHSEHVPPADIPDSDEELLAQCRVETFRAGGAGGQHQNRTDSAVRLVHLATGVRVVAREERSQHRNRAKALERLRAALVARSHRPPPRRETTVPARERKKRREQKARRSAVKRLRRPPDDDAS